MVSLDEYLTKELEEDDLKEGDILERFFEIGLIFIVLLLFLMNIILETGFFLNNFGLIEFFFLFFPLIADILTSLVPLLTRSKQKGRLPIAFANLFVSVGWAFLYIIPVWYNATKFWIFGFLLTNGLFSLLMIGGILAPLIFSIWEFYVYLKVAGMKTDF
jgi:hypothetical protein